MKKKMIRLMITGIIASSILCGGVITAYADETTTPSVTTEQGTDGGQVTKAAPVITVKAEKFLIEQGSEFDLSSALGLKVIDGVDGDITDKVTLPAIDTANIGCVNVTIKAINSAKEEASLPVVVNIVSFLDTKTVDSLDAVKDLDPSTLVNGKLDNLTVTLGDADAEKSVVAVTVSDGTNEITKDIALVDAEGNSFATGTPVETETETPAVTDNAESLPKTGTVNYGYQIGAYIVAILGIGYYIMNFGKKLKSND